MLCEVNKVYKDNDIFVYFLLYFVPTPTAYFDLPVHSFFKILEAPPFILTPPFIMNLRVDILKCTFED